MSFPIDWMRRKMPKLGTGLCLSQQRRERASITEGASRRSGDKRHLRSGEGVWSRSDQAVAPTGRGWLMSIQGCVWPSPRLTGVVGSAWTPGRVGREDEEEWLRVGPVGGPHPQRGARPTPSIFLKL